MCQLLLIPFNNVEAGNPILSPHSVQITTEDSHAYTGATSAGGRHVTTPLIGLRIISRQDRWDREKCKVFLIRQGEQEDMTWWSWMYDGGKPFNWVKVRRAVVTSHCIQQVIQDADTDSTSPFAHWRHHPPLVGLRIVTLNAGNGITAAPTTDYEIQKEHQMQDYITGTKKMQVSHFI